MNPPRSSGRANGEFGAQAENARRENARSNSRAARTVAGRSQDAQDCRLLLEMLGLDTGSPGARGPADD